MALFYRNTRDIFCRERAMPSQTLNFPILHATSAPKCSTNSAASISGSRSLISYLPDERSLSPPLEAAGRHDGARRRG
jgi:hypothetical protein